MSRVVIIIYSITISLVNINVALSRVDPPNYNFSLDALRPFHPGSSQEMITKKYGKGEIVKSMGEITQLKYYVSHMRYKFPVYVQIFNKKSINFFAKLPSYFIHDVFHRSLIARIGKQDKYFKNESNAIYTWKEKNGFKHTYSATCTITCFPIYYSGASIRGVPGNFKPFLKQFMESAKGAF